AFEFLLGKILAFMAVALAECALMMVLLFTYFGLHFVGDPSPFIVSTILYTFCVAAFGIMVGARVPSQAAALQAVALGGFLLVFLLSGLISDREHTGRPALAFQLCLGPLLHRGCARCAVAGRGMGLTVGQRSDHWRHRRHLLLDWMARHEEHAVESVRL